MSYHRSAAKSIALISSLVTAVALQGCHPQPTPPDERPAEIDLPKAGESINLDSFRTQLAGFYRGPLHRHTRRAVCSGPRSGPPGCVAEVTIQAIGKSIDIQPNQGPMRGRVVAHIRNTDSEHTTEMYSLRPSSQAEYYFYIDGGPSGARWNLLEVPARPFGPIGKMILDGVHECYDGRGHAPLPQFSDVDFSRCGEHYPLPYKRAGILGNGVLPAFFSNIASRFRAPLPAASLIEPGSWYKCPTGCCT